jgi:hypothetical protein
MDTFGAGYGDLQPNIGTDGCWFPDTIALVAYFRAPTGIMISANCIFCVLTICNYKRMSRQASNLKNSERKTSERNE